MITVFQSTASSQKATIAALSFYYFYRNFNPQLPRRKRRCPLMRAAKEVTFQSTASSQKATEIRDNSHSDRSEFQSTASSQKATSGTPQSTGSLVYFNPQLPRRKRREAQKKRLLAIGISIHSFLAESDTLTTPVIQILWNFNPQLPRRKRPFFLLLTGQKQDFNPQLPRRKRRCISPASSLDNDFNPQLPRRKRRLQPH